jgi:hypothetical protein
MADKKANQIEVETSIHDNSSKHCPGPRLQGAREGIQTAGKSLAGVATNQTTPQGNVSHQNMENSQADPRCTDFACRVPVETVSCFQVSATDAPCPWYSATFGNGGVCMKTPVTLKRDGRNRHI